MTLGFDGIPWPIYMGTKEDKSDGKKIIMNTGDIIIYKGTELYHWREKFIQGNWQAQVFLHYVDKNGPYSNFKFDNRKTLTHLNDTKIKKLNNEHVRVFENLFTEEACTTIIKNYTVKNIKREEPLIGSDENSIINKKIRNVERVIIPSYRDLGARLAAVGLDTNYHVYKFNITHCNQAEFLIYPQEGRYVSHIDTFIHPEGNECRKLTVLTFLNENFEGGKFFIMVGNEKLYPPQKKGTAIVFPSFLLHGVEDIVSGTRYSAVAWMCGPWFK
jgi:predicted 2-oxoglutarate/Fe(II)-dependent dioxygenase YbiX